MVPLEFHLHNKKLGPPCTITLMTIGFNPQTQKLEPYDS